MKIAMLTTDYLPNIGGITSHIVEVSKAMVELGHEVQVWHCYLDDHSPVSLETVPTVHLKFSSQGILPTGISQSRSLTNVLRKEIEKFQPDILHAHTLSPVSLSLKWLGGSSDYRRVLTNHSSAYLYMMQSWFGRCKAKFYCGSVEGILAPSQELLDQSKYLGLEDHRYMYIPNGVNPDEFSLSCKKTSREQLDIPMDRIVILATRRFVIKNGLRYLAEAVHYVKQKIPSILCIFCGDDARDPDAGEELSKVRKIIADYSLEKHIRFEGAVPNSRIKTYLGACDLMALPSLMEATSISALEAMSMGKPIVGTRVGGIPDLVDDGKTGLLANPADSLDLAECIIRLLQEYDLEEMGQAARARVWDKFTWSKNAASTIEFYNNIKKLPSR